jgi:hypothetical protein
MAYQTQCDASIRPSYSHVYCNFERLNQWLARSGNTKTSGTFCSPTELPEADNEATAELVLDRTLQSADGMHGQSSN